MPVFYGILQCLGTPFGRDQKKRIVKDNPIRIEYHAQAGYPKAIRFYLSLNQLYLGYAEKKLGDAIFDKVWPHADEKRIPKGNLEAWTLASGWHGEYCAFRLETTSEIDGNHRLPLSLSDHGSVSLSLSRSTLALCIVHCE